MKRIQADPQRRIEIAGVAEPVQRPVDIDRTQTGFNVLRSLRIYRFDQGSVIDGHAEEDEVLIVVMAGSVELSMMDHDSADRPRPFTLSAAGKAHSDPCAAYLPPAAGYRLVAKSNAEVAYARATPASGRPCHVFHSNSVPHANGVTLLLEENNYPQLLRLRLLQIETAPHDTTVLPIHQSEERCEAFVHLRTIPSEGAAATITCEPATLASWDTVAVMPGDSPTLTFKAGSSALLLVVLAAGPAL